MNFKLTAVALSVMALTFMAGSVQASEIYSDKVKLFEVKPQVCIVKKIGEPCKLQTTVHWQTTEAMKVCLVRGSEVLKCWQDQQLSAEKMAIVLQQASEVLLVDSDNDKLASEQLQINALNPKKQRRRLRSAWSLF